MLDVDLLLVNHPIDLVNQRRVVENEQVRVENARVLGAEGIGHFALHVEDLLAGLGERAFQPLDFLRQFRFGNFMTRNRVVGFAEHNDPVPAHPLGNRYAAQNFLP